MNNVEERELLRSLLNRVDAGESVVRIDDSDMYPDKKTDRRKYVLRRLKLNHDVDDITQGLKDNYAIDEKEAMSLIKSCRNYLNRQYKEYAANVAQTNIEMLQQIAYDALEDGQKKTAIEAIKELNRMCGIGLNNTFVQNNTQINFDNIEITFK